MVRIMIIRQISAFVENRPGRLAEITKILAESDVDMRALSIADTTDFGILRIIVREPEKVAELLKSRRVTVALTDVVAVKLPDKPGSLSLLLELLAENCISVEYLYAFVSRKDTDSACVVLRANDTQLASKVLTENGYKGIESL